MYETDSLVIGAGVVGLAIARRLAQSGRQVVVVEKESHIGQGISSRNSEVIHAGLYYEPSSLKAKTCVSGRNFIYDYARARGIPHNKTGKVIVAADPDDLAPLDTILHNAQNCGVADLNMLTKKEVAALEPNIQCEAGLFSPNSGIIDSHQLMLSYLADAESCGAVLSLQSLFIRAQIVAGQFEVSIQDHNNEVTQLSCRELINSGGLGAIDIAKHIDGLDGKHIPEQRLSRGCYFGVSGKAPFSHLVYPVPEKHGLGIHATLDQAGQVKFGPDHEWIDALDFTIPDGTAAKFYEAIRRYYPDLQDGSLSPGYTGIRPKILFPKKDGGSPEIWNDFLVQDAKTHGLEGLINLFGVESPGLTASSDLAEIVLGSLKSL